MSGGTEDDIHLAATRGDLEAVRHFVEVQGVPVDVRSHRSYYPGTPLMATVDAREVHDPVRVKPVLRYLISKNANVQATDINSWTALMHASLFGYSEAAKILLEEGGANVNYCNIYGRTAWTCALGRQSGHRVIPTLLHHGANPHLGSRWQSSLHLVRRDAEAFEALLRHFHDSMTEDDFCTLLLKEDGVAGNTSLHCAESVDIAKLLVEQPRRQRDKQLLPVCRAQLVSKNRREETPRETVGSHREEVVAYLGRYESLPLSIPGAMAICDSSSAAKRRKLNTTCAVKLNPALNCFQQSVAQEALDLITEMTDGVDAFAHGILGYLSLVDVMKRADK